MSIEDAVAVEMFRKNLKRIAWRVQYYARKQQLREYLVQSEHYGYVPNFVPQLESDLYVLEVLNWIPSTTGKYVMQRLILDELTEKEIATELNMSQQAVSKWKRKGILLLRQKLARS